MKRLISILLALFALLLFSVNAFADAVNSSNIIEFENFTFIFDETSTLSREEQLHIAHCRANIDNFESSGVQQKNVLCSIFGHKITTETVVVIEHKVSASQPRCLRTVEDITSCTRCDTVTNIDLLSSTYIYCFE